MNTREGLAHGISVIHQELSVIPDLTVAENIFLGREPKVKGTGLIDKKAMIQEILTHFTSELKSGQRILFNLMAAKGRESFYKQFGFLERPDESAGAGMTQLIIKP